MFMFEQRELRKYSYTSQWGDGAHSLEDVSESLCGQMRIREILSENRF